MSIRVGIERSVKVFKENVDFERVLAVGTRKALMQRTGLRNQRKYM